MSDCDLSLDDPPSEEEEEETARPPDPHVLGAPPSDEVSTLDEEEEEEGSVECRFAAPTYDSGESDFDVDNADQGNVTRFDNSTTMVQSDDELEPRVSLSARPDTNFEIDKLVKDVDRGKYSTTYIKLVLSSALASFPDKLRRGFAVHELKTAIQDAAGLSLPGMVVVLLGREVFESLPDNSEIEYAHALVKHNWLRKEDGRFFPVMDESLGELMEDMVRGAEQAERHTQRKKEEAQKYPSVEAELKALRTFNLICELMRAYMDAHRQNKIPYQTLAMAFKSMVEHNDYSKIYSRYKDHLPLAEEERWNGNWFKEYTNRSSLKKFISMGPFSAIFADKDSMFAFRDKEVKLYGANDFENVRKKWSNEPTEKGWRGYSGERNEPAKKKEIVPDPDYKPVQFANNEDDGSLGPSTSANYPPPRSVPTRPAPHNTNANIPSHVPLPPPARRSDPFADAENDPFGSSSNGPSIFGASSSGQYGRSTEGLFKPKESHGRLEDMSSGDEESDGQYSDESEGTLQRKREEREKRRKRKEEQRKALMEKLVPVVVNPNNRFKNSVFDDVRDRSPSPLPPPPKSSQPAPSTSRTATPPPVVVPETPKAPTPSPPKPAAPPVQPAPVVAAPLPMNISRSSYNEEDIHPPIPFRAADHNKPKAQDPRLTARKPAPPPVSTGFTRKVNNPGTSQPVESRQNVQKQDEEYRGMNHQRPVSVQSNHRQPPPNHPPPPAPVPEFRDENQQSRQQWANSGYTQRSEQYDQYLRQEPPSQPQQRQVEPPRFQQSDYFNQLPRQQPQQRPWEPPRHPQYDLFDQYPRQQPQQREQPQQYYQQSRPMTSQSMRPPTYAPSNHGSNFGRYDAQPTYAEPSRSYRQYDERQYQPPPQQQPTMSSRTTTWTPHMAQPQSTFYSQSSNFLAQVGTTNAIRNAIRRFMDQCPPEEPALESTIFRELQRNIQNMPANFVVSDFIRDHMSDVIEIHTFVNPINGRLQPQFILRY